MFPFASKMLPPRNIGNLHATPPKTRKSFSSKHLRTPAPLLDGSLALSVLSNPLVPQRVERLTATNLRATTYSCYREGSHEKELQKPSWCQQHNRP